MFDLDPNFSEEIIKKYNNSIAASSKKIFEIYESLGIFPINFEFKLDSFVQKYRSKKNNLKNIYVQISDYFQS